MAGHRIYTGADVTRPYQVLALRQMGLGLGQIAAPLAEDAPPPKQTLRRRLDAVERDLRQTRDLRDWLARALDALGREDDPGVDLLLQVIQKIAMFEDKLTGGQRAWFTRRRETVGEQCWQQGLDRWPQLIAEVRAVMDADTDQADPFVQRPVTRWDELTSLFLDDDPDIRTAAGKAWQPCGPSAKTSSVARPAVAAGDVGLHPARTPEMMIAVSGCVEIRVSDAHQRPPIAQ